MIPWVTDIWSRLINMPYSPWNTLLSLSRFQVCPYSWCTIQFPMVCVFTIAALRSYIYLASSPGHSQIFLHGCKIKSGTRLIYIHLLTEANNVDLILIVWDVGFKQVWYEPPKVHVQWCEAPLVCFISKCIFLNRDKISSATLVMCRVQRLFRLVYNLFNFDCIMAFSA